VNDRADNFSKEEQRSALIFRAPAIAKRLPGANQVPRATGSGALLPSRPPETA
jgi:hypothetical protein